jgi:hypothetical protein
MLNDKDRPDASTQAVATLERELRELMEAALEGALVIARKGAEEKEAARAERAAYDAKLKIKSWTHVLMTLQQEKGPTFCAYCLSQEWEDSEQGAEKEMRGRAKELGCEVEQCVFSKSVLKDEDAWRLQDVLRDKYGRDGGGKTGASFCDVPGMFVWQESRLLVPCSVWSWFGILG